MIVRVATLILGCSLLIFGIGDLLLPRARFVRSEPAPGSTLNDVPSSVLVHFTNKLSSESSIDVTSTIRVLPNGEMEYLAGSSVVSRSGLNAADPEGKSLRADLKPGLHKGLYWVSWRTTSEGWRSSTYGKSCFAVGMPVPQNIAGDPEGVFSEHTYQWRGRRAALLGGLLMLALAMYLWRKQQSRPA